MIPEALSFVDVETTGTNAVYDRIIEIGILRVEKNKVVKTYQTLINPHTFVDPFIQKMTGIDSQQLAKAPSFYDVKDTVIELLRDSLFVAHNARFDYSFIKNELKRLEISLSQKHLCTVKLARQLFPDLGRYNLDIIINAFNISIKNRHRAFDDAKAIWSFYKKAQKKVDKNTFTKALNVVLRRPSTPIHISHEILDNLPESPGVYIFYGDDGAPLYIGKSVDIKDRVLSHFANATNDTKEMKLAQQVKSIETFPTHGELGALLLESTLIKKHKPLYNRMLRENHKLIALKKIQNNEGYFSLTQVYLEEIQTEYLSELVGVFRSQRQVKDALVGLAKEYNLCQKLMGLEKTRHACFGYQLDTCFGACIQKENFLKYNMRFVQAFSKLKIRNWPFAGPIVITEGEENFIFDKWCYVGGEFSNNLSFDYDTYKILVRFLLNKNNQKKIKVLQSNYSSQNNFSQNHVY